MRETALVARQRRHRMCTTDSRHDRPVAPNLVARNFQAVAPDRVWVADITYIPTREGWLYLAVVLDLFARRVVGWATGLTLERELVLRALGSAIERRRPGPGLLYHSDRGAQYAQRGHRLQPLSVLVEQAELEFLFPDGLDLRGRRDAP